VVVATLVTFILPESFSSTARIKVERDHTDIPGLAEQRGRTEYDPYYIQTQFEMIQSELIMAKVVETMDLNNVWGKKYANGERLKTSESLQMLKGRMDLRPVRNTSLIEIRVFSEVADEAAKVSNALAEAYQDYRVKERTRRIEAGIRALEMVYEQNNSDIRRARAELSGLTSEQSTPDAARSDEVRGKLEYLRRFGESLFTKLTAQKADLLLPATGMVEIIDRANPGVRPVRPNKPLNIVLGIVMGGVGGLLLATLVYWLQCRAYRQLSGIPRSPFPARFRAIVHILIALVVGIVVGYQCATPLELSSIIVVPLALLLGGAASAYIELANPGGLPQSPAASYGTKLDDADLKK
jgi:uncharacterized protein involved in exopolysaccharide biosynthesis